VTADGIGVLAGSRGSTSSVGSSQLPMRGLSLPWLYLLRKLAVEMLDHVGGQGGDFTQMPVADRCQAAEQLVRRGFAMGATKELIADGLSVVIGRLRQADEELAD
jgi:hypothetical protein